MSTWDDYRDPLGFLSGARFPRESGGNAILFAAHERRLRLLLGDWGPGQQKALESLVETRLEISPGLIRRPPPFEKDAESMDNYVGYASISPVFAKRALDHGKTHFYKALGILRLRYQFSIQGSQSDPRAWLGRYPTLIAFLKQRALDNPSFLERLAFSFSLTFSGDATQQDPWVLNWHLASEAPDLSASRTYWRRLAHHYPGGLAQVFMDYLDDPEHPIIQACHGLKLGRSSALS